MNSAFLLMYCVASLLVAHVAVFTSVATKRNEKVVLFPLLDATEGCCWEISHSILLQPCFENKLLSYSRDVHLFSSYFFCFWQMLCTNIILSNDQLNTFLYQCAEWWAGGFICPDWKENHPCSKFDLNTSFTSTNIYADLRCEVVVGASDGETRQLDWFFPKGERECHWWNVIKYIYSNTVFKFKIYLYILMLLLLCYISILYFVLQYICLIALLFSDHHIQKFFTCRYHLHNVGFLHQCSEIT